jgi:signal transduction histidine kinase
VGYSVRVFDDFIRLNRQAIITRAREKVSMRTIPRPSDEELEGGVPVFLDQLGDALLMARSTSRIDHAQISQSAERHGRELLGLGLTIAQVVHGYGDVCQTITELAIEQRAEIKSDEFQTLNLCLDDAIAAAVTAYTGQRERALSAQNTEQLGALSHELRNLLATATLSFESIRCGHVSAGGSTGMLLSRSLIGLGDLITRSLVEVRLELGLAHTESIRVADFLEEIEVGALIHARARGLTLAIAPIDRAVAIQGDRQTLAAAVSNLLQNAFKFTHAGGGVSLTTRITQDRVRFEVEDECGGLPPGRAEELFRPFEQRGADRSGIGLGLSISVKAARANAGDITVRDLPGKGCVFTLDLPRGQDAVGPDPTVCAVGP